jgi:hypothetical protein
MDMDDRTGILHTGALLMAIAIKGTDEEVAIADSIIRRDIITFDALVIKYGKDAFDNLSKAIEASSKK